MELLELAERAARAAGAHLRGAFSLPRTGVGTKTTSTDMVTDADRRAEELIAGTIRSERPGDGILGEESGEATGSSGLRWVIDPLDGTTNYLYGIPQWAVSVACEDERGPVAGVVYDAMREEIFTASRDGGAERNGSRIEVSAARDLSRALIATGFSYRPGERRAAASLLPAILPGVRDLRRAGAAALDLAWVACGRLDGYYESPIEWWDVAAGSLLVAEAGGRTCRIPSVGEAGYGYLAAGPGIFEPLRALVRAALDGAAGGTGAPGEK